VCSSGIGYRGVCNDGGSNGIYLGDAMILPERGITVAGLFIFIGMIFLIVGLGMQVYLQYTPLGVPTNWCCTPSTPDFWYIPYISPIIGIGIMLVFAGVFYSMGCLSCRE
jgi:hypothetical protein